MMQQAHFDTSEICWHCGVRYAIFSPGSRNAPLSVSFARNQKIKTVVSVDERSAGFLALGLSLACKEPVILCCTSGTALLNYLPAVAEAWYQGAPLIILSADRPSEWIDQWDGQTIRQMGVYSTYVKAQYNMPEDTQSADARWQYINILRSAILIASTGKKAPVHVNIPVREPFYPEPKKKYTFSQLEPSLHQFSKNIVTPNYDNIQKSIGPNSKVLIVMGHGDATETEKSALQKFVLSKDITVVTDSISNFSVLYNVVSHQDFFQYTNELAPDILITFGKSLISKNLKLFLRKHKPKHFHISEHLETADPFQTLPIWCPGNLLTFIEWFSTKGNFDSDYTAKWKKEEIRISEKLLSYKTSSFSEFYAYKELLKRIPEKVNLHVANSMSVRYVNMLGLPKRQIKLFANRGTSGIEGSNATAVGHSLATEDLVVLFTGDLAFLYDTNAFWIETLPPNLRVVVFNNSGGGIFGLIQGPSSLPVEEYTRFFLTPHNRNIQSITEELGFEYRLSSSIESLESNIDWLYDHAVKSRILEVRTTPLNDQKEFSLFKQYIQ